MIKTPLSTIMGGGSNLNVTDELEFADFTAFPVSGETSKLYIALDVNRIYRWTGSAYVEITASVTSTVDISLGGTGATTAEEARTNLGLGSAAVRGVTTGRFDSTIGRVMTIGDLGFGSPGIATSVAPLNDANDFDLRRSQFLAHGNDPGVGYGAGPMWPCSATAGSRVHGVVGASNGDRLYHAIVTNPSKSVIAERGIIRALIRTSANTTVDANGFIKNASPIVQLFADKIELNNEAQQQNIVFEKLGVGDYIIKGSSGFAQEGWYIETPKDANGNVLFSVIYTTLENGNISVKTYKKKFDLETASIVADLTQPVDITAGRWIDLRLQELPQPEIEVTDDPEQ